MSDITEWYPPEIKPVRIGWYETYKNFEQMAIRRYWDGERWSVWYSPIIPALDEYKIKWRGLTEPENG